MFISNYSSELSIVLGTLIVWLAAALRFNDPRILVTEASNHDAGWKERIKQILSWSPGKQSLLLRPPRANTTMFRYLLY